MSTADREREELERREAERKWEWYIDLTIPIKWAWRKLLEWNEQERRKREANR